MGYLNGSSDGSNGVNIEGLLVFNSLIAGKLTEIKACNKVL